MVKCWKLVPRLDNRIRVTCPAQLSRWISKGLDQEPPESRSCDLTLPFLPLLPSIWRELTTRRLHGQSLEPQGWLEVCLKLRHWPDSVINSIYRCVRVQVRVTSKCDRPTPRACVHACVCVRLIHQTMLAAILSGGRKGNRESKIERRKNSSKTATMPTISRCWDAVVLQFFAKLCFRCNRLVLQGKWNIYFHYY